MKSLLRTQIPPVLAGFLIAGALAVGTAQAAPVALDPGQPATTAVDTADSGSGATGSLSSSNLAILRVLILCPLGLLSGQSCNLMP
ncbi:hypothetical protein [Nocardia sp. NPDC020380]|uniref:hypothetical protein n=1 Tax=Nocardia sp. NPDC020380 TaxID=3364309 RepID=UPI0037AF2552